MRSWRNWQTRTFEGRVGNRMGSSPIDRTKFAYFSRLWEFCSQSLFSYAEIKTCAFIRFKILLLTMCTMDLFFKYRMEGVRIVFIAPEFNPADQTSQKMIDLGVYDIVISDTVGEILDRI